MPGDPYVVVIKPSARRTASAVGEWVNREGPRRVFASKPLAREWARRVSGHRSRVWIQDAPPHAGDDADGYLVGGRRRPDSSSPSALVDDPTQPSLAEF